MSAADACNGTSQVELNVRRVLSVTQAGGAIFTGENPDGRAVRVIASPKALPRVPCGGETWQVEGNFAVHPEHGLQLRASRCTYRLPQGRLLVRYLADNPAFQGIGETKALKLYAHFGDDLLAVLNAGRIDDLRPILTAEVAERLLAAWADKRLEASVIAFLDAHGFDARLVVKLRRAWGEQALSMLQQNPYYMLAFSGWQLVDRSAIDLNVALDDPRRLVGAVESVLHDRLQQAHTLTPASELSRAVAQRLRTPDASAAITLALAEGAIVGDSDSGFQSLGAAALEAGIAKRMHAMLADQPALQHGLFDKPVGAEWISKRIAEVEAQQGFSLNGEQQAAVHMALAHPLCLLTGGAGVGKTTVLRVIIALAEQMQLPVLQMALAGRAAKRMAQATNRPAMTIAKFLIAAKSGHLCVSEQSLVIVDEASMLDLPTLYRILRYMPDGARLLLVGDPAQLPPIGFGLVFHRLVESSVVPKSVLEQVHRQAAATGIPSAAAEIRRHVVPRLDAYCGQAHGVSFIDCEPGAILGHLFRLADRWDGDDWQILAATRHGAAGIDSVNDSFHQQLASARQLPGFRYAVGEPVIHLINDYERGLMNGTLGRIAEIVDSPQAGLRVDFEGQLHFLPTADLVERLSLAYAISVHKAQGSQFRRVAVVLTASRVLDHALVYTALTRGTDQVVFIGDRTAFESAVNRPAAATQRCVAFSV